MVSYHSANKRSMRQFLLLAALMCFFIPAFAQSLSVESFRLLENDLTANTFGTIERDQNGEVAALIKVVTSETGFVFDGGMLGIVKTEQKTGEIWVYVPAGLQKITVSHQQLGVLRDYYFPISVEKARTYEMRLLSGRVKTVIEDELTAQFVTFTVEPKNALVYFDGRVYPSSADGTVSQLLTFGSHEYRVELPGYKTEAGTVQVGAEKIFKDIKLESAMATITLICPMAEAEIFLNGESKGKGNWAGELLPAIYQVETRRYGFQPRYLTLTVEEQEVRTVSLPEPVQLYGKLQVKSSPFNATVLLDGEEIGTTPLLKNSVTVAPHRVELRLEGYRNYVTMIEVNETGITELEYTLVVDPSWQSSVSNSAWSGESEPVVAKAAKPVRLVREKKDKSIPVLTPTNVYAGVSVFSSNDFQGMDIHLGGYFSNINMELNYCRFDVDACFFEGYWNMMSPTDADYDGDGVPDGYASFFYRYETKSKYGMVLGYGLQLGRRFRLTPQAGLMVYSLSSEGGWDYSIEALGESGDKKSYMACVPVRIKMEYSPVKHVSLVYYPGLSIIVGKGELATELDFSKDLSEKFKGLTHNIGLQVYF